MNDIDFERAALLLAVVNSGSPDPLVAHIVGEARAELGEIDAGDMILDQILHGLLERRF